MQSREKDRQAERIEVRHGRLSVKELVFELPAAAGPGATVTVTAAGQAATVTAKREGAEIRLTFANPLAVSKEDVPADLVEKEAAFAKQEAIDSGKPAEIAEKMVAGKINKFLAANALLEQPFVRDDSKKVKEILGAAKITAFARFAVGSTK